MSEQKKHSIAITAADSLRGGSITYWILRNIKDEFSQVRALVRYEDRAEDLKRAGADIKKINYDKPETIEQAFQDVRHVILIAEDDDDRVQQAEKMIAAAKKSGVEGILFLSTALVEKAEQKRIREFKEIEEKVGKYEKRHGVLRISLPYQLFFLWSRAIQEEGKFPMSVKPDSKWAPIDLHDVGKVIHKLLTTHYEEFEQHKIITVTGPELLKADEVVKKLNKTLGFEVEYKQVSREEMKKYLEKLRQKNEGLATPNESEDGEYYPHRYHITDGFIELILDALDVICEGKGQQKTDDLKNIIGNQGVLIVKWFHENAAYFRGHEDNKQ